MQSRPFIRLQTTVICALLLLMMFVPVVSVRLSPRAIAAQTATIRVDATDTGRSIDERVLGTNLPAWLNPTNFGNTTFRTRTVASGATVIRIPGGSWSNYYDWLACERNGQGIDSSAECYWPWASRPSDFIDFLQATGNEVMYTVNQNGTAKEAAALVAFFNGDVNDRRVIGVDVRGRDWLTVGHWARLRRDNGNPEPLDIKLWEVGNEIYGGDADSGKDCAPWGWENVWTCDGIEYVNGMGSGNSRKEGYLDFRNAMRRVDSTIKVGAVGVPLQSEWNNWGNEVIAAAGDVMDFYSIHQYAYFSPPASYEDALAQPHGVWEDIMQDVQTSFDRNADGRRVPIAVTEYNLFSVQEQDTGDWMSRAVNALFMADTLGQMMTNGFSMANQWDLAHGEGGSPTGYGLMRADTFAYSPQYFVFPLWSRFGGEMLPVTSSLPADTTLSVYAGRDGATLTVLAINKTDDAISSAISLDGVGDITSGTADVMQADSLDSKTVTFNGVSNPSDDLSNAPAQSLTNLGNPLNYTFAPYSITLLRLNSSSTPPPATNTPPPGASPTSMPTHEPTRTPSPTPDTPAGDDVIIYDDRLQSDWVNWSWNTSTNFSATNPRQSGSAALSVRHDAGWAGLYLHNDSLVNTTDYDTLRFWIHGGSQGGQQLRVWARGAAGAEVELAQITAPAGTWQQVELPLTDLSGLASINDIVWQDITGGAQPTFYLDNIALVDSTVASAPSATETPEATRTSTRTPSAMATHTATAAPTRTNTPLATNTPVPPTATRTTTPTPDTSAGDDLLVYADKLQSDWVNWSWNTSTNFSATNPRQSGSAALSVRYNTAWAGLYLHNDSSVNTTDYDTLRFWIHGGRRGGQQLRVWARGAAGAEVELAQLTAPAGTWQQVELPLTDLSGLASINDIVWQDITGGAQPTFYLDNIALVAQR